MYEQERFKLHKNAFKLWKPSYSSPYSSSTSYSSNYGANGDLCQMKVISLNIYVLFL